MHFIDEVTIRVSGGNGGNGCVAFRREAHVPRGGPAGGDGGDGGDVVLVADPAISTLLDLRYRRHYRGVRGRHGEGHDRHGRCGEELLVPVPCGTEVWPREGGELLADLVQPGQRYVAAAGGRGGRGNSRFVSSVNRAPRQHEPGEPGQERELTLRLKLIADVGLVGLPNAGKSSLIRKISAARPRVADYPFTTLAPKLGLVSLSDERSFVVADIPGLIEGAHQGAGLGHRFLRHIERTRTLVYLVDDRHPLYDEPGTPLDDFRLLRDELAAYSEALAAKPQVVVLNKIDMLDPARRAEIRALFAEAGLELFEISALGGEGLTGLLEQIWVNVSASRRTKVE